MRSLGAFVLLAGICVGLFVYWPTPVDHDTSLENAQQIRAQARKSNVPDAIPTGSRWFSPHIALDNLTSTERGRAEPPASTADNGDRAANKASTPAVPTMATGWQSVVTDASGTINSGSGAAVLKPKDPASRYELVVTIQRNLKTRGCYRGRIDGSWGATSKSAMQAFIDRVNATLPIAEPDDVLLTLLQANNNTMCGGCPAGQTLTVGGSCAPPTTIADTQRQSGGANQGGADVLPWQRTGTAQPPMRPVGTIIVTTAPLQERMAIGGPTQLPPSSGAEDDWSSNSTAVPDYGPDDADLSEPSITRAARREAERSRSQYRTVQSARQRNLMLSLGGAY